MREPPFSPNALFFFLLFPHPHFAPRLPSAFIFFSPTFPLPLITNILFLVKRVISGISGQWTTRTKIVKTNGIPPLHRHFFLLFLGPPPFSSPPFCLIFPFKPSIFFPPLPTSSPSPFSSKKLAISLLTLLLLTTLFSSFPRPFSFFSTFFSVFLLFYKYTICPFAQI
uniref:Uncharacterized protein n=1 Tax=Meloidogyne enterolobii TaxID=390850 RepID=A0A6V7UG23_MELEN|nr:unnamed protein product [Meloidogyne enterolobii]